MEIPNNFNTPYLMIAVRRILLLCSVAFLFSCKKEGSPNSAVDPIEAARAISDVSKAARELVAAESESRRNKTSAHAAAELQIAARRLDEAKLRAKAAGFTDEEIRTRALNGKIKGVEEIEVPGR